MPGVRGRVLEVLARTDAELTMRTVARLAGVSVNRAVAVLNSLVSLGVVERREAGSAALVQLVNDNEAARSIVALAQLFDRVLIRLKEEANLPDGTTVYVVVPSVTIVGRTHIHSPRLANREDAKRFEMEVEELPPDADI